MERDSVETEAAPDNPHSPRGRRSWRFQVSLRALLVLVALMSIPCLYLRRLTEPERETLIDAPWANASERRKMMAQLRGMTDDQLETAVTSSMGAAGASSPDKEACLVEIVRRSWPWDGRWSKVLENLIAQEAAAERASGVTDVDADLELLTALRRVNREPDPLAVESTAGKEIVCTLPNWPSIDVQLANRDVGKRSFWITTGGDSQDGRRVRYSIEMHDESGQLLSARDRLSSIGGGGLSGQFMRPGDVRPEIGGLYVDSYVVFSRPGAYRVRILYDAVARIADDGHTVGRLVYSSEPIRLVVKLPTTKIDELSHATARRWISALPETGPIAMLIGPYGPWIKRQIPPESAAGHLLGMGFQALPDLLAELHDPKISAQRRGWMLALLSSITGLNDPIPSDEMSRMMSTPMLSAHIWLAEPDRGRPALPGKPADCEVTDFGNAGWGLRDPAELLKCQLEAAHCWDGWEKFLPASGK